MHSNIVWNIIYQNECIDVGPRHELNLLPLWPLGSDATAIFADFAVVAAVI